MARQTAFRSGHAALQSEVMGEVLYHTATGRELLAVTTQFVTIKAQADSASQAADWQETMASAIENGALDVSIALGLMHKNMR